LNLSHTSLSSQAHSTALEHLLLNNPNLKHVDLSFTQLKSPVELMRSIINNDASLQCIHMDGVLSQEDGSIEEVHKIIKDHHEQVHAGHHCLERHDHADTDFLQELSKESGASTERKPRQLQRLQP